MWVEVGGLSVHCLHAGETGSPVLLLHGGGLDSAALTWRFAIGPLSERHRVVALDLPGFGESVAPQMAWSLADYVAFVDGLLDALALGRVSLVGISLGGAIALGSALRSPEHVQALVLVDSYGLGQTVPGGLASSLFAQSLLNELTWALLRRSRGLIRGSLHAIVCDPSVVTEDLVDEVHDLLQRPDVVRSWLAVQRSEVQWRRLRTSYLDRLPDLAVPTLVVHGANDRLVPEVRARRACAVIKACQLNVLDQCGHWPPRERPDAFNHVVVSFLGQQASVSSLSSERRGLEPR